MKVIIFAISILCSFSALAYPNKCNGMQDDFKKELSSFYTKKLRGITLFVGSSSIKMWKNTHNYFDELFIKDGKKNYYNRGFGGSQICHLLIHYKKLFVGKNRNQDPKRIIIYSGDNDLSNNLSATDIVDHYEHLIDDIRRSGVKSPIYIIATKPSVKRNTQQDIIKKIGTLLEQRLDNINNVYIINTFTEFFDVRGNLKVDFFKSDGLHLKPAAYRVWAKYLTTAWDTH
jgi:lysophospholipase L1-like esterase